MLSVTERKGWKENVGARLSSLVYKIFIVINVQVRTAERMRCPDTDQLYGVCHIQKIQVKLRKWW